MVVIVHKVWGLEESGEAKSSEAESSGGRGEWRPALTTRASPTATLSGLRQARHQLVTDAELPLALPTHLGRITACCEPQSPLPQNIIRIAT